MVLGLAAWVAAAGLWIDSRRAAHDPRANQHPLARVQLPLDRSTDWRTATFVPRRHGPHVLILESSSLAAPPAPGLFGGAFDVEIRDPYGRIVFQRTVDGQAIEHAVPSDVVRTDVGRFDVPDPGQVWAFTARVVRADARFAPATSFLYVGSPAAAAAGWRVFGSTLGARELAALGALLLVIGRWLAGRCR